jgi:hypothetical protein
MLDCRIGQITIGVGDCLDVVGGPAMLQELGKELRECYEHAEDCGRRASIETDAQLRKDFLDMEARWLRLAQSIEFTQRLDHFANPTPKIKRPQS